LPASASQHQRPSSQNSGNDNRERFKQKPPPEKRQGKEVKLGKRQEKECKQSESKDVDNPGEEVDNKVRPTTRKGNSIHFKDYISRLDHTTS
jgi:hypothetical protein